MTLTWAPQFDRTRRLEKAPGLHAGQSRRKTPSVPGMVSDGPPWRRRSESQGGGEPGKVGNGESPLGRGGRGWVLLLGVGRTYFRK